MRHLLIAAVTAATLIAGQAIAAADEDVWPDIKHGEFGDRAVSDAGDKIVLEAPTRAQDAATVPISVRMPAAFAKNVKTLTLIVDRNPSPIVGTFAYGEAAGAGDRLLATRIRVNQYTDVRAVAETTDGRLFMTSRFVKASGGCSAPATKDPAEAAKDMGKMQIKTAIPAEPGIAHEALVMIRHPNYSGLQMDPVSHGYTPAHIITKMEVRTGGKLVFAMEGGISISENPNFRFSYEGNPSDPMTVQAEDSMDNKFEGHSIPGQS